MLNRFVRLLVVMALAPLFLAAQGVVTPGSSGVASIAGAQSSSNTISLDVRGRPAREVISEVARQAGMEVLYANTRVALDKPITMQVSRVSVQQALGILSQNAGVNARVSDNGKSIWVDRAVKSEIRVAQGVITGRVTDGKTGNGILGANVSVDNSSRGIATNEDGSYRLTGITSGTHAITVRLVGYAKQTRSVTVGEGAAVTADFKLEPSANVLDQVVVTGTVTQTELKAVPNAITVVTAKQIEERGITRIDQLFRGEIPGLFSAETGTAFGAELGQVIMYSRGTTKIVSVSAGDAVTDAGGISNPIKTYVDGVEMANSQFLSQIDPKSIERIEILAGPQASTIYGAGALNGVMQIFTKRGSSSRPQLSLNVSSGVAQNNFSAALAPSHLMDGRISGTEGKLSYSVGSSWNYLGSWSPGNQTQRTSIYGGGKHESGSLSIDISARQGWTENKIRSDGSQVYSEAAQTGAFLYSNLTSGLVAPNKRKLSGKTVGLTVRYAPFSWWSHQFNVGNDASDTEQIGSGARYRAPNDTSYFNNQNVNSRSSQTYSATLHIPVNSIFQTTVTYGADHWRVRSSALNWSTGLSGTIASPSITRNKPSKNSGAFVQGQFGFWDQLFITYGMRADWNPNYGSEAKVRPGRYGASYSRDFGMISAKVRGSYGRSIRPPDSGLAQGQIWSDDFCPKVIFGSFCYSTFPSPDLGPEFQQGGEGGLEIYWGNRGSLVVTRYNQTVDGLVNTVFNVDSTPALESGVNSFCGTSDIRADGFCYRRGSQSLNVGSIRNQGWELQGSVNAGPFTTRGTYSWVKSRVIGATPKYRALLSSNAFIPGATFNYIPEHTWSAGMSYIRSKTSVAVNVNGLTSTLRPANGELTLVTIAPIRLRITDAHRTDIPSFFRQTASGYATASMNASHRLSGNVDGTLQVSNLTNFYRNDLDSHNPTLGRQTNAGVRIRF